MVNIIKDMLLPNKIYLSSVHVENTKKGVTLEDNTTKGLELGRIFTFMFNCQLV